MQFDKKCDALWPALFFLSLLSLLVPFIFIAEPPLLDYPNHLARTFILAHLDDPAFRFSEFYRADWKPYPSVLWDILMVALQQDVSRRTRRQSARDDDYRAPADRSRVVPFASQSHRN